MNGKRIKALIEFPFDLNMNSFVVPCWADEGGHSRDVHVALVDDLHHLRLEMVGGSELKKMH